MANNYSPETKEEIKEKRPPFGNRFLIDPDKVFQHNAWDNVEWDEEQIRLAEDKIKANSSEFLPQNYQETYEREAGRNWDRFYSQHQNRFFKDRRWLFTEFPELAPKDDDDTTSKVDAAEESKSQRGLQDDSEHKAGEGEIQQQIERSTVENPHQTFKDKVQGSGEKLESSEDVRASFPGCYAKTRMLEVGCGVGNTVFPILQTNIDDGLFVYCCDFSEIAVNFVKTHSDYNVKRCHAFVSDVTDLDTPFPFPENSLDIIIMIFVLSAIKPERMQATIDRLARHLKPGGRILLRDYGRYDLAQLRFKKGRCLSENFYVRGDGTRVYFFTQDDLRELFTKAGLVEEQNLTDKRLQVNRGRQITMYRVWIQCKYRKPNNDGT